MNHGNVLVKVYGHVWPVTPEILGSLRPLLPLSEHLEPEEMLAMEKDLLRVSFEGLYFPLEDLLETLQPFLTPESKGKFDYLDMEGWTLTRHNIQGTHIVVSQASLNNILDYSGH